MKAVAIASFGGIEKLQIIDLPIPTEMDNEVLIRIAYTAVNPVDWKIREGYFNGKLPHEFPLIPGWDAAGTIERIGKNVKILKKGDEVFAYCRKPLIKWGTYADYITFDADHVAKKPENITFAQAAAIPLAGLTAWQALFDAARLRNKETILIHAGAGGVGGLAIQFAKIAGAEVIATASKNNHAYVKKLGADHVIDYHDDLQNKVKGIYPEGVDVVFDTVGGETLRKSLLLLKPHGRLISIVEQLDQEIAAKHNVMFTWIFVSPNGSQLNQISNLISQGKVLPPNILEMPLMDAAKAQEKNRERHVQGKIVLRVN
jgi:NADPH2:quinone reductase